MSRRRDGSQVATTRVMSCPATVAVVGERSLLERGVRRLHDLERRWSRFLPRSEISVLNAAAGRPVRVSDETVRLVEALVRAWHVTDGAFDPTLLGALVGLGYAASRDDSTRRTSLPAGTAPRGDVAGIRVGGPAGIVVLPPGTTLDAGGLGKGLAADLVVEELLAAGARGALVEIGGDLRVDGEPPDGDRGWTIDVTGPQRVALTRVVLASGAVATSSTRFRRWTTDRGAERHHLVDPATLRPCRTDVVSCTVVAGTAAWAEGFAKVGFVRAPDAARALWERHDLAAMVVTEDGRCERTATWARFDPTEAWA